MIWSKRFFYLLLVLLWLFVMALPFFSFRLAKNGEIQWGSTRIFLVTEKGANGVGSQTERAASNEPLCQQTVVRYWMWKGSAENNRSCSCLDGVERRVEGRNCIKN